MRILIPPERWRAGKDQFFKRGSVVIKLPLFLKVLVRVPVTDGFWSSSSKFADSFPARPDFNLSMTSSRGNSEQHFNFSQQSIVSSGIGTDQATLSPTSPRLPPRKPVAGIDPFQGPRDNYERVNEWLQSPPPSTTLPTELLMPWKVTPVDVGSKQLLSCFML